jgi:lipoic acid synthetase
MLGLGESLVEIEEVMRDLRSAQCDWITIGQYLQPSSHHYPLQRYVTPDEFSLLKELASSMGFSHVASGPLVRSSYHADSFAEEGFNQKEA